MNIYEFSSWLIVSFVLTKFDVMGVHQRSLKWLESYLTGRKQTVCVNNGLSKYIYVLTDVPQGSQVDQDFFFRCL